jgi:hypothetical protein
MRRGRRRSNQQVTAGFDWQPVQTIHTRKRTIYWKLADHLLRYHFDTLRNQHFGLAVNRKDVVADPTAHSRENCRPLFQIQLGCFNTNPNGVPNKYGGTKRECLRNVNDSFHGTCENGPKRRCRQHPVGNSLTKSCFRCVRRTEMYGVVVPRYRRKRHHILISDGSCFLDKRSNF